MATAVDGRKEKIEKLLRYNIPDKHLKYYFTKYPIMGYPMNLKPIVANTIISTNINNDEEIFKLIRSNPDLRIITFFNNPDSYDDELAKLGTIHYVKHIELSKNGMRNLMFQLYADKKEYKTTDELDAIACTSLTVICFEPSEIPFIYKTKTECLISQSFYEAVQQAMIYFNQNSLDFLEHQLLDRFLDVKMRRSRLMLLTLRNWIYTELSPEEQDGLLFIGSSVLYVYGLRNMKDVDVFYQPPGKNVSNSVKEMLIDDDGFPFVDAAIPNTKKWKGYWNDWQIEFAGMIGADNFADIINNPKFHFYYLGMKFIVLDAEIGRRFVRSRPASIVDLFAINKLMNRMLLLPKIPERISKFHPFDDADEGLSDIEISEKYSDYLTNGAVDARINRKYKEFEVIFEVDKEQFFKRVLTVIRIRYPDLTINVKKLRGLLGIKP